MFAARFHHVSRVLDIVCNGRGAPSKCQPQSGLSTSATPPHPAEEANNGAISDLVLRERLMPILNQDAARLNQLVDAVTVQRQCSGACLYKASDAAGIHAPYRTTAVWASRQASGGAFGRLISARAISDHPRYCGTGRDGEGGGGVRFLRLDTSLES